MFEHWLITRFNVHTANWTQEDKHGQPILDDAWMEHRIELFNKYCWPSVRRQRAQFKWLILIDKQTPDHWTRQLPIGATLLRCNHMWLVQMQRYLNLMCEKRWLITTRLDNDDAIAPWMTQYVQDRFAKQQEEFLDFPFGYRLKDGIVHPHYERFNPFMSFIERIDSSPVTVMAFEHGRKLAKFPNQVVTESRAWAQVIHDRNKVTDKVSPKTVAPCEWMRKYVQ